MPNYYAHLKFGDKVLEELPRELAGRIGREEAAFHLGCLGPDPLFFYHPIRPNGVRREGVRMHRASALPAAERLRQAIEDGARLCGQPGRRRPHLSHGHRGGVRPHAHGAGRPGRLGKGPPAGQPGGQGGLGGGLHGLCPRLPGADAPGLPLHELLLQLPGPLQRAGAGQGDRRGEPYAAHPLRQGHRPEGGAPPLRGGEQRGSGSAEQLTAFFRAIEEEAPVPHWFDRDFKGNPPRPTQHISWPSGRTRHLTVT